MLDADVVAVRAGVDLAHAGRVMGNAVAAHALLEEERKVVPPFLGVEAGEVFDTLDLARVGSTCFLRCVCIAGVLAAASMALPSLRTPPLSVVPVSSSALPSGEESDRC